jgi:hypothetical protein
VIYVIAILCPPLATLFLGKPFTAICHFCIWLPAVIFCSIGIGFFFIWIPILHSCILAGRDSSERRFKRQIEFQRSLAEWQQTKSTGRDIQNRLGR